MQDALEISVVTRCPGKAKEICLPCQDKASNLRGNQSRAWESELELSASICGDAAVPRGGMARMACHAYMPALSQAAWPTGFDGDERRRRDGNVPESAMAAGAYRHWPRQHVPHVAWPRVPPLRGDVF
jgi:hypothetical protein